MEVDVGSQLVIIIYKMNRDDESEFDRAKNCYCCDGMLSTPLWCEYV